MCARLIELESKDYMDIFEPRISKVHNELQDNIKQCGAKIENKLLLINNKIA